jgi:regulator of sigma E protease
MTTIAAIIALGILIFVHELGHFLAAKRCGVGVEKFSLGFGPKIIGKKIGETEYLISAVPLGGYVKMVGEDPKEECLSDEKSFSLQPVWKKLIIVFAGPAFNLLFAAFLFILIYSFTGVKTFTNKIGDVVADYPAYHAGLMKGDVILSINEKKMSNWRDITEIIYKNPGKSLKFKVMRNSQELVFFISPKKEKQKNVFQEEIEIGLIGIRPAEAVRDYNPLLIVYQGFKRTYDFISLTILAIVKLIQRVLPAKTIGGPIMIFQMVGEQVKVGILNENLYVFLAILSINLGILNLLPIPILDVGHIMFFLIEAIRRKPISLKKKEIAQQVGLFLLVSLMLLAFYNDITRIFIK